MKIINCTPHEISFVSDNGDIIRTISASGILPRVATSYTVAATVDGVPDEITVYGDVEGLPAEEPETILVVSALVANACKNRKDLRSPPSMSQLCLETKSWRKFIVKPLKKRVSTMRALSSAGHDKRSEKYGLFQR